MNIPEVQNVRTDAEAEEMRFIYDQLRKEILQNEAIGVQILGGTLIIVGAIMTIAISNVDSDLLKASLFLSASVIAIFGLAHRVGANYRTALIASYLRVFVEANPTSEHLKWETRFAKYPGDDGHAKLKPLMDNERWSYLAVAIVNVSLAIGYAFTGFSDWIDRPWVGWIVAVVGLALVATLALSVAGNRSGLAARVVGRLQFGRLTGFEFDTGLMDKKWKDVQADEVSILISPQP